MSGKALLMTQTRGIFCTSNPNVTAAHLEGAASGSGENLARPVGRRMGSCKKDREVTAEGRKKNGSSAQNCCYRVRSHVINSIRFRLWCHRNHRGGRFRYS